MDQIVRSGSNNVTAKAVYFYTPRFYVFDNFSAYTVQLWEKVFLTGQHAYQWKKFSISHPDIAQKIFDAQSPHEVKKISDAHAEVVLEEWHEKKMVVMEEILRAKILQHENVRNKLAETAEKTIYENSPIDSYWGVGKDGKGQNMLGKIWMKLRDELV